MAVEYHVYGNDGAGGPIDYSTVVATVSGLSYAPAALALPSDNSFAVRAFDAVSTLEEQNVDAVVRIAVNASGVDVANQPLAPSNVTATATASGGCRVDWSYPYAGLPAAKLPTAFLVYLSAGGTLSYASPAATIAYSAGLVHFSANLTGLSDEALYTVGVRAQNATAAETNTNATTVTGEVNPPGNVDDLTAVTAP